MPIYGFGTIGAPWKIAEKVLPKNYYKLRDIFKKAKKSFEYSNADIFIKNIQVYSDYNNCTIATYDSSKLGIEVSQYQIMLEKLINEANNILNNYSNFKNYKFDIIGNWTIGKVIIMEKS